MSQKSVVDLLKEKKVWLTVAEIAHQTNISKGAVCTSLNKLFKYGEIKRRLATTNNPNGRAFEYKI